MENVKLLRANADRRIKMSVPSPFTILPQAENDHYPDEAEMPLDYAAAVNAELEEAVAARPDIVQLEEPRLTGPGASGELEPLRRELSCRRFERPARPARR